MLVLFLWHPIRKRFTSLKRLSIFSATHHFVHVKNTRRPYGCLRFSPHYRKKITSLNGTLYLIIITNEIEN